MRYRTVALCDAPRTIAGSSVTARSSYAEAARVARCSVCNRAVTLCAAQQTEAAAQLLPPGGTVHDAAMCVFYWISLPSGHTVQAAVCLFWG